MKPFYIIVVVLVLLTILSFCFRPAKIKLSQIAVTQTADKPQTPSAPKTSLSINKLGNVFVSDTNESLGSIESVDSQGNLVLTWIFDGPEEQRLIGIMTNHLPGISSENARKAILVRYRYNWKNVPISVRADDLEGMYAYQIKQELSGITDDIEGVLTAPIGDIRYPPRMDSIIRTNMQEEIESIKSR